jgi:ZIP family zinc transporter
MVYVSLVEIFNEANRHFEEAGFPTDEAYLYATISFFSGVIVMVPLNFLVSWLLGGHDEHEFPPYLEDKETQEFSNAESAVQAAAEECGTTVTACPCCSEDPAKELECLQEMALELGKREHEPEAGCSVSDHEDFPAQKDECVVQGKDQKKLLRMSINTALAIGIHNFPEGLATFVATLDNPRVGAILAVAIAIHNIPEGLCIAMPIYYATGNRWRAFGWAMVSGMSEPLAALLGWAVLASCFTQTMFGALFGVVSGMMVIVSVRELLPTAHRYDPDDVVVTYSFMAGMLVMAVSLVLFLV